MFFQVTNGNGYFKKYMAIWQPPQIYIVMYAPNKKKTSVC